MTTSMPVLFIHGLWLHATSWGDTLPIAFGNPVSEEGSNELFERWTIPAPGKSLSEAALANFTPHSPAEVDTANAVRGPLLLMSGGKDHTVPESVNRATLKQYRRSDAVTDIRDFPDRGHSLTWLRRQGL
ncbi:hypothetical protein EOT10_33885 [Streptomyces antnestii]|uniref:Peptidase S9 prolyl oligopeptidase catalytic domain-containing protein n=1 Tax=Streptomyces antnestii TaxID=2494256 RepID=A0A3S2WA43_9ACTN|nr:hypothetical protein [Streptomyces sp. San01]RVU17621.1 hypothetical protein EOT10_33885 [Streptomyces sp. San01]